MSKEPDYKSDVLTVDEAAVIMKLHVRTVYKLLLSDELKGKKVGRVWRIPRSAIEEYLRS